MTEFWKLVVTALATGIVGSGTTLAVVELLLKTKKDKRDRSEIVNYLALQLAFQFEDFAIECQHLASQNQDENAQGYEHQRSLTSMPELGALPVSDAYRFFEPDILNRVFAFSQRCKLAQGEADNIGEHVGGEEYNEALEENTIKVGYEALQIARTLRKKYKLGDRPMIFDDWSLDEYFPTQLARIKEQKDKQAKSGIDFFATDNSTPKK